MKIFGLISPDLGIDLGTANTLVYKENAGIIINEPSMIAIDVENSTILAVGKDAKAMMGKSPENVIVVRPLANGVISDFDITQTMLNYFIKGATPGFSLLQPRVVISVPSSVTDVERRAVEDAALHAGARDVYLIEESLAAAMGAGLQVEEPYGHMIVNIGAGTTEVAVISLGGTVVSSTERKGGENLDYLIQDLIKTKYSMLIGENVAEDIKKQLGTFGYPNYDTYMEVSGRDIITGMPKTEKIFSVDVANTIRPYANEVIDQIRTILEKTPPDLSGDIIRTGITMTGGGALMNGLRTAIENAIGIPVEIAEDPSFCTIKGAGEAIKKLNAYQKNHKK